VTIGIDNPGTYQDGLPPSGSLTLPFEACTNHVSQVTYYITALASNGDRSTRELVVKASP
jgi:hypothetical protein